MSDDAASGVFDDAASGVFDDLADEERFLLTPERAEALSTALGLKLSE